MSETPEEAIAVMRQSSEVVSSVLPSALAELVYDKLLSNIDAVLHGSTPQMQWVAYEVLALAEQPAPTVSREQVEELAEIANRLVAHGDSIANLYRAVDARPAWEAAHDLKTIAGQLGAQEGEQ